MNAATAGASAARPQPASLPDTLIEIAYRPPTQPQVQAMAGYTPDQAVAVLVETLAVKPGRLAADAASGLRCWITDGPGGPRLARLTGLDAAAVNLAIGRLVDAGTFQRIAA